MGKKGRLKESGKFVDEILCIYGEDREKWLFVSSACSLISAIADYERSGITDNLTIRKEKIVNAYANLRVMLDEISTIYKLNPIDVNNTIDSIYARRDCDLQAILFNKKNCSDVELSFM